MTSFTFGDHNVRLLSVGAGMSLYMVSTAERFLQDLLSLFIVHLAAGKQVNNNNVFQQNVCHITHCAVIC